MHAYLCLFSYNFVRLIISADMSTNSESEVKIVQNIPRYLVV